MIIVFVNFKFFLSGRGWEGSEHSTLSSFSVAMS